MVEMATIAEVARTLKNIALGASPWAPGQGNYGVGGFTADELTAALASGVPGARVEAVDVHAADAMTTDHAHLALTWNETGRAASLPAKLFTKGTPAAASTRILNSAFGLCQNEVRFYNELYPAVAGITLTPYGARLRSGGRFAIALATLEPHEARFFELGSTVPLAHAESVIDALARLHAAYWESPRFAGDLNWLTPYSRQPGWPIGQRVMPLVNRTWLQRRDDVPARIKQLTTRYLKNQNIFDAELESLPPTFCHGDTHAANTFARADGSAGLFDWQQVHKAPGMRDVTYFIGWSLEPELRAASERDLIGRYLDGLRAHGIADAPSLDGAYELHRWLMMIAWNAAWAPLAMYGGDDKTLCTRLLSRFTAALHDLDTAEAVSAVLDRHA
ncbi:phosphotransferase [Gordonia amarae]|uniref:phosphotransferase n=1 Tax=Gordonia amarae TaxID=36821 RepID=UPI001AF2CAFD|nr:phosphotransferase [Gordonia amarae]QHN29823.1 phosphotransferase [Gordonia amarae]